MAVQSLILIEQLVTNELQSSPNTLFIHNEIHRERTGGIVPV